MSNKSERTELEIAGARAHKNSGRGMVKGDGSDEWFVIDVKEASKSFTLNEKVWNKICTDAYKVDPFKAPQLLIVLGTEHRRRLAIIESSVLTEMKRQIAEYQARVEEFEAEEWFRSN